MPPSFSAMQQAAAARHQWPTAKTEGWQFTRLTPLTQTQFTPATQAKAGTHIGQGAHQANYPNHPNHLVFRNGILHDTPELASGIAVSPLSDSPALMDYATKTLNSDNGGQEVIADLAIAHADTAHVVRVTGKVATPLTLSFDYAGDGVSSHAVLVFDCAENAQLTLLEEHNGTGDGLSLPLMLFRLAKGSNITHARRLLEASPRSHLGLAVVDVGEEARYHAHTLLQGGTLARSETRIGMNGEEGDALLNTIYMARDRQMHDITSNITHNAANCLSFQRVHGIVAGEAKSVFQGKVKVARGAQKTDGNQMSRTLLLSRTCEVNTKPELEIYADDVACSHGATLGEIDDGQLFYLKSRGIPHAVARQMLIVAFLEEVLEAIEDDASRQWLTEILSADALAQWCADEDTIAQAKPSIKGRSAA